jgi:tetratricopeptide (TPR) repeat protein
VRPVARALGLLASLAVAALALAAPDPAVEAGRLYRDGRLAEAETLLRAALDSGPDRADLRFLLGLVQRDGTPARLEEAAASFRAALRLEPAREDAAGALGEVLLGAGKTEEAEEFLRARIDAYPDEAVTLRLLGAYLAGAGHADEGLALLERAIRVTPEDPHAWLELGRARMRNGDVEGAVEALEEARRLAPDFPSIRYSLAQAYLASGREAEGSAEMEAYTAAEEAWSRRDQEQVEAKRIAQAIADYQSRIRANQDLPVYWYENLLTLHDMAGTLADGRRFFEQLAAEHPDRAGPRVGLALLADREDRGRAWRMLLDAHYLDPTSGTPLQAMSRMSDTAGRRAELARLLAVVDARPDAPREIAFLRGLVALQDGRLDEAREQMERARLAQPENLAVLLNLGVTYGRLGRNEEAATLFGEVLETDPGHQEARFNRALALASRGDLEASAADLEHLLANGFEEPRGLNLLARIRDAQGRREEAVGLLERSLAADPDQPAFREMLQRLRSPAEGPGSPSD